jgi:hypothetical protein
MLQVKLSDRQMFKKPLRQGRSERDGEAYFLSYVEPSSDTRTKLDGFFNTLLG